MSAKPSQPPKSDAGHPAQVDEKRKDLNGKGEQPRPGTGSEEAERWDDEPSGER
ncbi:hypothetical protein [Pseudomonas sp. RIT-PI-AD]|uniref:hypothetical protein n=1 Tax=Pseudomonas sp. RIT-PI-AD TaxID=3035294 RepID=UPI0021D8A721|nr:hypothetical protein [Pseudomonas sp. RIT-PI-AD]